jgi:hypothetical protein
MEFKKFTTKANKAQEEGENKKNLHMRLFQNFSFWESNLRFISFLFRLLRLCGKNSFPLDF